MANPLVILVKNRSKKAWPNHQLQNFMFLPVPTTIAIVKLSFQVEKRDQIFPLFVMQVMGDIPCVPGLFVAGIFSGALSTVSSGLK